MPTFEQMKRGYGNLWAKATLNPNTKALVLARARRIVANRARYQSLEAKTSVPWWWIAVAHNLEGGGSFDTYLGNGQKLSQRTTIKPKGRGPFKSFEEGALDAIYLKGFEKIKSWDVARALYHWEEFNGFGYISKKINSPYVWSMTPLYTKGKYVADHVYDPDAVSEQVGAAAMLLGLIELGAVTVGNEEKDMAELHASLLPFEKLAPVLITTLAGPAARLAISVLADAIEEFTGDDTPAKPDVVKQKVEALPTKILGPVLQKAEDAIAEVLPPPVVVPPVRAEDPVPAAPVTAAPANPDAGQKTVVVQPVEPAPSILDRYIPAGFKTVLGIVGYCGAGIAVALGYITPEIATAIQTGAAGLISVGLLSKLERWLPVFAGYLKATKKPV